MDESCNDRLVRPKIETSGKSKGPCRANQNVNNGQDGDHLVRRQHGKENVGRIPGSLCGVADDALAGAEPGAPMRKTRPKSFTELSPERLE